MRAGASPPEVPADLLGQCFDDPPTIGAFEAFPAVLPRADTDHDGLPDDWEQAHRLDPLDPTDAGLDADEDGLSNGAEYVAGTDPRDAESTLRLRGPERGSLGFAFVIPTTPGRLYRVEGRPFDLLAPWSERAVHWGTGGELAWGEVPALGGTVYRVRVEWTP